MVAMRKRTRDASSPGWIQDPEGVRRDILAVARAEFAERGLSGARVDAIAAKTSASKRMIYYYFGDKEGLFCAVLEEAYERIRSFERALDLAALPPCEALARLTGFTFDYHADNPDFVRLVMIENIHHARHLSSSTKIGRLNLSVIEMIAQICRRGCEQGLFRDALDPVEIHLAISALSFYSVSNRASIRQVFGLDMGAHEIRSRRREATIDAIMRMVAR